jgi:hypothetical protein
VEGAASPPFGYDEPLFGWISYVLPAPSPSWRRSDLSSDFFFFHNYASTIALGISYKKGNVKKKRLIIFDRLGMLE